MCASTFNDYTNLRESQRMNIEKRLFYIILIVRNLLFCATIDPSLTDASLIVMTSHWNNEEISTFGIVSVDFSGALLFSFLEIFTEMFFF